MFARINNQHNNELSVQIQELVSTIFRTDGAILEAVVIS